MSLKELEGFKVLECEQEHGSSAAVKTSPGDTRIVETSLEDLEFGFSVVRSTQKVTDSLTEYFIFHLSYITNLLGCQCE